MSQITGHRAASTCIAFSANRWEFVRTGEGWKIKRRTLRQLDGTKPVRGIGKRRRYR